MFLTFKFFLQHKSWYTLTPLFWMSWSISVIYPSSLLSGYRCFCSNHCCDHNENLKSIKSSGGKGTPENDCHVPNHPAAIPCSWKGMRSKRIWKLCGEQIPFIILVLAIAQSSRVIASFFHCKEFRRISQNCTEWNRIARIVRNCAELRRITQIAQIAQNCVELRSRIMLNCAGLRWIVLNCAELCTIAQNSKGLRSIAQICAELCGIALNCAELCRLGWEIKGLRCGTTLIEICDAWKQPTGLFPQMSISTSPTLKLLTRLYSVQVHGTGCRV